MAKHKSTVKINPAKKSAFTVIRTTKSGAEMIGKTEQLFWYTDDTEDGRLYFLIDNRNGRTDHRVFNSFDGLYRAVEKINEKER